MSCPSCIVALAGDQTPNTKSLADILGPYTTRIILVAVGGLIGYGVPRSRKLLWTAAGAGGGFLLASWMARPEAQLPAPAQPYVPPADMPVFTPPADVPAPLPPSTAVPQLPAPSVPSTPSVRLPALPGKLPVTVLPQAKVPSGMRIVDQSDGRRTITPQPSPCVGSRLICGAR